MRAFKKYFITLILGFLAVGGILWAKDILAQTELVRIFHILCDAFFAVGTLITCIGLLVFSSNEGTFDMIVYGVSSFFDLFRTVSKKKYETFYDYRESRADKKISFGFLLICGLFFLAVSFAMYFLYRQYK